MHLLTLFSIQRNSLSGCQLPKHKSILRYPEMKNSCRNRSVSLGRSRAQFNRHFTSCWQYSFGNIQRAQHTTLKIKGEASRSIRPLQQNTRIPGVECMYVAGGLYPMDQKTGQQMSIYVLSTSVTFFLFLALLAHFFGHTVWLVCMHAEREREKKGACTHRRAHSGDQEHFWRVKLGTVYIKGKSNRAWIESKFSVCVHVHASVCVRVCVRENLDTSSTRTPPDRVD